MATSKRHVCEVIGFLVLRQVRHGHAVCAHGRHVHLLGVLRRALPFLLVLS
jgi:hypothetical protein